MKKLLCFLFIAALCSCKTQTDVKPLQNKPSAGKSRALSHGDGLWDVLGYGIDATLNEHDPNSTSLSPVINVAQFAADYNSQIDSYIDRDNTTDDSWDFSSGLTALDYSSDLTKTQGFGLNDKSTFEGADSTTTKGTQSSSKLFTLSFSKNSTDHTTSDFSSRYAYATANVKHRVKRLAFTGSATMAILMNYLTPAFLSDVNNLSADDLVARYGTHVLLDISIGGVAKFDYSTISTTQTVTTDKKSDIKAGIGADVSKFANVNINYNASSDQITKIQNTSQNTIASMTYYGGTTSGLTINIDKDGNSSSVINFGAWEASVATTNAAIIDVGNALYLSDFIADPTKKAAVQAAIQNKINAAQITVATDPVYVFYNPNNGGDHFTVADPNATAGAPNWSNYGVDFKAFLGQAPGTVPVYWFYNTPGGDHYTSSDRNATNGFANWQYNGILFYAYATQVPGTVPVYIYYNAKGADHFTTVNPNIDRLYPGWVKFGVSFYAFPNN